MKSTSVLKAAFFTSFFTLSAFVCQTLYAAPVATVQQIQGEVSIQTAGSPADQWTPVSQETPVNTGDSVKTGNGSCIIAYADQATFNLEANTSITLQEQADTQDIALKLGKIYGKIDHTKVTKPFQVVTPAAVATVRGTDVSFDFDDQGQLTVDIDGGGPVQVTNDEAGMDLELQNGNKITVKYNAETGEITVSNSCDSTEKITFSILGKEYSVDKCESQTVSTGETAAGANETPGTDLPENEGPPNENEPDDDPTPPSSPVEEQQPE